MLPAALLIAREQGWTCANHRKIAVMDGRIAFTGSQNLVAADFMRHLMGPAVLERQYIFVANWFLETKKYSRARTLFVVPKSRNRFPFKRTARRLNAFPR